MKKGLSVTGILLSIILSTVNVWAQQKSKISAYTDFTALDYTFTEGAALPWYLVQQENGHYEHALGDTLQASDTITIPFNAQILTNVHGDYLIRYALAYKDADTLKILFEDGMPAYASTFTLHILEDSFWVVPHIVFPDLEEMSTNYEVVTQSLKLYHDKDIIQTFGYIDFQFQSKQQLLPYYFKGYFVIDY